MKGDEVKCSVVAEERGECGEADLKRDGIMVPLKDTFEYSAMAEEGIPDMVEIDELNTAEQLDARRTIKDCDKRIDNLEIACESTTDADTIAAALLTPEASTRSEREELLAHLKGSTLLRQWSCEALLGAGACNGEAVAQRASAQLLSVTLLPGVGLIAGIALLLRELWRRWRGKAQAGPRSSIAAAAWIL